MADYEDTPKVLTKALLADEPDDAEIYIETAIGTAVDIVGKGETKFVSLKPRWPLTRKLDAVEEEKDGPWSELL